MGLEFVECLSVSPIGNSAKKPHAASKRPNPSGNPATRAWSGSVKALFISLVTIAAAWSGYPAAD